MRRRTMIKNRSRLVFMDGIPVPYYIRCGTVPVPVQYMYVDVHTS